MKKINLIIINLFVVSAFLLVGCDKDNFNHATMDDINTTTSDSLQCRVWLQNTKEDTTNIFNKGENIKVGISLLNLKKDIIHVSLNSLDSNNPSIYRAKDNKFVGYPYTYMSEAIFIIAPVPSQKRIVETFTIVEGKTSDEHVLPKGEYYLRIAYRPDLCKVDTVQLENTMAVGKIIFPEMRVKFKIK